MDGNRLHLKICGMRDAANILEVGSLRVDYMGFIFYKHSPRYVGENFSIPLLASSTKRVGVFVNESTDAIARMVDRFGLDLVQLHGNETPEVCAALKKMKIVLIKAFSVGQAMGFKVTAPYHGLADYFLFDTKGQYFGGNGSVFNWDILQSYDQATPFFLSGGLTPHNVSNLQGGAELNIYGLDFNSGVEIAAGLKDIRKVREAKQSLKTLQL